MEGLKEFQKNCARKNTKKTNQKRGGGGGGQSQPHENWSILPICGSRRDRKKIDPKFSRKHQVFPSSPEQFVEKYHFFWVI